MLLVLQPNKITLLREITRPKPWAQLLNSIKKISLWLGVTKQRQRQFPRGLQDCPDILSEAPAIVQYGTGGISWLFVTQISAMSIDVWLITALLKNVLPV
jgi:hypothetical protein